MHEPTTLTAEAVQSIDDIGTEEWDACANPPDEVFNPFLRHAYFEALAKSGSAG